jgi:hypothetical protein
VCPLCHALILELSNAKTREKNWSLFSFHVLASCATGSRMFPPCSKTILQVATAPHILIKIDFLKLAEYF